MDSINNSILITIKKLLGIEENYTEFDTDIIIHINSCFTTLNQLGVGPKEGFFISDKTSRWTDFIQDIIKFESVKTYIYIKVRLIFDPPTNSFVLDSLTRQASELEWRLNVQSEEVGKE